MSVAIEKATWRDVAPTAPPQNRAIQIVANIVDRDEWSCSVESYEGFARWDEGAQDWLNEAGLSIRGFYESELVILEWSEARQNREFVLRMLPGRRWQESPGAVSMIRALKPLPLPLPSPAWMSDAEHPAHKDLYKLTDGELEARLEGQSQFIGYLLDGRGTREHLWLDYHDGACRIERALEHDAGRRWLIERRKAREQATARRRKKARATK